MTSAPYVDTSALAKYYIAEAGSVDFESYIRATVSAWISQLTLVEFRCMLARRRRAGSLEAPQESGAMALFVRHVAQSLWQIQPIDDPDYADAARLIDRMPSIPLRPLDAIHLAGALKSGASELATADRILAAAAAASGLKPVLFG
jgi:predicted nucleic acid-binding protein